MVTLPHGMMHVAVVIECFGYMNELYQDNFNLMNNYRCVGLFVEKVFRCLGTQRAHDMEV